MLGDHRRTVRVHFGEREADPLPVRHLLEEGVVPAAALGTALDDVTRHDCTGDGVDVVVGPAERVQRGPDHQGGIGHPARHHHLRPGGQRVGDRAGPEIGVRRHHGGVGRKGLARVEVDEGLAPRPQPGQVRA